MLTTIAAIIAWAEANPAFIALGRGVVQEVVNLVKSAVALHSAGALDDAALAAVWAAVGVDAKAAGEAWNASLAAGHTGT